MFSVQFLLCHELSEIDKLFKLLLEIDKWPNLFGISETTLNQAHSYFRLILRTISSFDNVLFDEYILNSAVLNNFMYYTIVILC